MPGGVIPVKAKIKQIQGYSAHADKNTLFRWLYHIKSSTMITRNRPVKKVFVVQGEEESARDFAQLVNDRLGIEAVTPSYGQTFNL
ncbi:MAG: hypothetical protein O2U61_06990 [Candidatus Bathyarchaeota archaeon]|nr:hypothetical protein [Candidatus Bathyarchaeota archaeon]